MEPLAHSPGPIARDFRSVVELPDQEAVMVATPDHWHALCTMAACPGGQGLFMLKSPLSLGRVMLEAAHKYNRAVRM